MRVLSLRYYAIIIYIYREKKKCVLYSESKQYSLLQIID